MQTRTLAMCLALFLVPYATAHEHEPEPTPLCPVDADVRDGDPGGVVVWPKVNGGYGVQINIPPGIPDSAHFIYVGESPVDFTGAYVDLFVCSEDIGLPPYSDIYVGE